MVAELDVGHVEGQGAFPPRGVHDLVLRHEQELGLRVDEPLDEPGQAMRSTRASAQPRHPLHRRSGALVQQAVEMAADCGAGEGQVLAHRDIVPALDRHRPAPPRQLATERDDAVGPRGIVRGDPPRPASAELDPFGPQRGDHAGRDRGIRLGPGRIRGDVETALGGQALKSAAARTLLAAPCRQTKRMDRDVLMGPPVSRR